MFLMPMLVMAGDIVEIDFDEKYKNQGLVFGLCGGCEEGFKVLEGDGRGIAAVYYSDYEILDEE